MILYQERQRVYILDLGAPATVVCVSNRGMAVTVQVDEAYLEDPEDDGIMSVDPEDLRPALLQ